METTNLTHTKLSEKPLASLWNQLKRFLMFFVSRSLAQLLSLDAPQDRSSALQQAFWRLARGPDPQRVQFWLERIQAQGEWMGKG